MYETLQRFKETGTHAPRPKSGRPKVSGARDDRLLVRASIQNRKLTVPALRLAWQQAGVTASDTTVRRRLSAAGLNGHVAVKKPLLTARHRQLRLEFARRHEQWSWVDWSCVLFTDESKFNMFQTDGRVYIRRRTGERFNDDCVVPTVKFGGGGVMVWGAMTYRGTGMLTKVDGRLNGPGYVNILQNFAVPSAHILGYGDHYWLQDDNAPCHRARIVENWKEDNDVRCLQWPPQSPDLNPIETLWSDVKCVLRNRHSRNMGELERNVKEIWNAIPRDRCSRLVRSMPRRIQAVIDAHGGHTKY